jgi:DNA-binding NarL/FixJ family response regulator
LSIRLVLADDHPIVLQGLQHLFARHADFEVVACCADGVTALDAVRTHQPDVAVIDLRMPGTSHRVNGGLELLQALGQWPACRRIVLTAAITPDEVVEVLRSGASGLILKESSPDKLLECVRSVHAGERWLDAETVTRRRVGGGSRQFRRDGDRAGRDGGDRLPAAGHEGLVPQPPDGASPRLSTCAKL